MGGVLSLEEDVVGSLVCVGKLRCPIRVEFQQQSLASSNWSVLPYRVLVPAQGQPGSPWRWISL